MNLMRGPIVRTGKNFTFSLAEIDSKIYNIAVMFYGALFILAERSPRNTSNHLTD
jgi:hypothetical protein